MHSNKMSPKQPPLNQTPSPLSEDLYDHFFSSHGTNNNPKTPKQGGRRLSHTTPNFGATPKNNSARRMSNLELPESARGTSTHQASQFHLGDPHVSTPVCKRRQSLKQAPKPLNLALLTTPQVNNGRRGSSNIGGKNSHNQNNSPAGKNSKNHGS